jgi:hypothetical protein
VNPNVENDGFAVVFGVLSADEQKAMLGALGPIESAGRRGLLGLASVAKLARSDRMINLVRPHLPLEPVPVRAIYFNKSSEANWLVAWHQDLTISVPERVEMPGFGPWSMKDGVPHVQPPIELLQAMLAVRLHLDDADESNGALRIIPGSHKAGRLNKDQIQKFRAEKAEFVCAARAGDALLMRPLLLHASGRSKSGGHRRILHIEYAGFSLPPGLSRINAVEQERTEGD